MTIKPPIQETCIYCGEVIETIPVNTEVITPRLGILVAIADISDLTKTEIGLQKCTDPKAIANNNGNHLSKSDFMARG